MKNISVAPGKNNVGAYINDLNLNNLNLDQTNQIKEILNKYGVIFIKKQSLDSETYQNFAKSLGQLVEYPRLKGLKNYPILMCWRENLLIKVLLLVDLIYIKIHLFKQKQTEIYNVDEHRGS